MDDDGSLSKLQLYMIGGLCCIVLSLGLCVIFSPKESDVEAQTLQTSAVDRQVLDSTENAIALSGRAERAVKPWWEWALERLLVDLEL